MKTPNITWQEFEVLQLVVRNGNYGKAKLIDELKVFGFTNINQTLDVLIEKGLLANLEGFIEKTSLSTMALEPYRVKRAVILAAGEGLRLRPETDYIPKAMIKVNKKRIIESQIDALLCAGISDITIVTGYLKEAFDELLQKYPTLKFMYNSKWRQSEATVSTAIAADLLDDAYLLESDIYIDEPEILRSYEYQSSYAGLRTLESEDWYFAVNTKKSISQLDYGLTYKFVGIMFWTSDDAKKLRKDLRLYLQSSRNNHRFIETLPFDPLSQHYDIVARPLPENSVYEIDTVDELQALRKRLNFAD
jgi:L-glutamine-phosphate cytidylyltransferase